MDLLNGALYRYIPKIKNTQKFIEESLDESERQDFYRMKKITDKKRKIAKEKEALAEIAKEKEALAETPNEK